MTENEHVKIMITDRDYSGWKFVDTDRLTPAEPPPLPHDFNPLTNKLIFSIDCLTL